MPSSIELVPRITTHRPVRQAGILSFVARALVAFVRGLAHRRDVHSLLDLDDRALKDIGLVRSDVIGALAEPLANDPSKILLVRSVERRARVRALDVSVQRAGTKTRRPTVPTVDRRPTPVAAEPSTLD